jgi:multiple sugar transport system substrate-binding protein
MRQMISKLWGGEDAKSILDPAAAEWDAITEKIGVDKQKAVYQSWAAKSGAYPQ